MSRDPRQPPTLESLLRLKRAETPTPEFWTQFERDLRQKQLAAIVEKRPWWCTFPRAYVFVLRHNLQIGSVAALSLAFLVSYHEFRPPQSLNTRSAEGMAAVAEPLYAGAVANVVAGHAAAGAPEASPAVPPAGYNAAATGSPAPVAVDEAEPSERLIEANLAAARASGRMFNGGLSSFPAGFQAQVASVSAQEPLARMTTPWEERRSRLMAGPVPAVATDGEVPSHIGERLASRLSDDRLYESMSRYGVGNGGVSIKF